MAVVVLWGLAGTVAGFSNDRVWVWAAAGVGLLLFMPVLARLVGSDRAGALYVLAWPIGWWLQRDGLWEVSHGLPVLLVFVVTVGSRNVARDASVAAAGIARSAPLLVPLVLVVLVVPSLSEDVWKVADALTSPRLAALFALTVGVLFVLVYVQLRSELASVLASRAEALCGLASRAELTREVLASRLSAQSLDLAFVPGGAMLDEIWPSNGKQYAPFVAAAAGRQLTRPLAVRLAACVLFVAIAVSAYVYVLTVVLVDSSVVGGWTGDRVAEWSPRLLGVSVDLPAGAFVTMTALLGCLAVATFLAFAMMEERFSTALGDALLRLPADRLLVIALPYLALIEEAIVNGDPVDPAFDIGRPDNPMHAADEADGRDQDGEPRGRASA